jgi:hypothetical protein
MKTIIDNLLNGNLSDAKKGAKRASLQGIIDYLINEGETYNKALLTACYLKGKISFQEYCDNNNNSK